MANSNTYIDGLGSAGTEATTLAQIQGAGLSLPTNVAQFIDTRAPGKLEVLFNTKNNSDVLYTKNKPQDLYLKGLIQSQLSPPFYTNPNEGQKNKIGTNRSLPVQAALRDATRISRFMGSGKGTSFITTQVILQGFQSFDETKIYNPASPFLASIRPATFGLTQRPTRFIDSSNILGGLLGASGLGGVVSAVGGLFGATPGNPSPPRSSVASRDSAPSGGLGGFLNIGGIFGGGDKSAAVMPVTGRDGVKGLLRGNTATTAYNNKRYSSLLQPKPSEFFSNLLNAAGSFLKNNSILGGILPPKQPIAGLNYRADEDTYKLMLLSDRWSNFTIQGGDKSRYWDPGVNQGNLLLYSGTQSTSKGGFFGALLSGLGFNTSRTTNAGSSAVRFYNGGNSSNKLRLYVNKNIDNRINSKLTTTFDTTQNVGKLSLSSPSTISAVNIQDINSNNIANGSNRYGDVVKIDQDAEYSDQLFNYKQYSDPLLSKNYQRTISDPTSKLVKQLKEIFDQPLNKIKHAGYDTTNASVPQQFITNDVGFNYLSKVTSVNSATEGQNNQNDYTYVGRIRKDPIKTKFPTRLGTLKGDDGTTSGDRFINPTNNIDYVNSLTVLNNQEFTDQYDNKFNGLGPDFVKFYFYDIVNERYIPFKATIKGLTENNAATWEPVEYLGRPDKLYYYKGFTRDLNFSFKVVAGSIKELLPMWQRINYLTTLTRPSNYTSTVNGGFMIPPMVQLTLGDFYKGHFVIINSVNIQIPEDAAWELVNEDYMKNNNWSFNLGSIVNTTLKGKVSQFPREAEITLAMNIMEKDRPKAGRAVWGNAPVATDTLTNQGGQESAVSKEFNVVDIYNDKDYNNANNNTFSKNVRYDVDVQGK